MRLLDPAVELAGITLGRFRVLRIKEVRKVTWPSLIDLRIKRSGNEHFYRLRKNIIAADRAVIGRSDGTDEGHFDLATLPRAVHRHRQGVSCRIGSETVEPPGAQTVDRVLTELRAWFLLP